MDARPGLHSRRARSSPQYTERPAQERRGAEYWLTGSGEPGSGEPGSRRVAYNVDKQGACVLFQMCHAPFATPPPNSPSTLYEDLPFEQDIFKGLGQRVKRDQGMVGVKAIKRARYRDKSLWGQGRFKEKDCNAQRALCSSYMNIL